MKNESVVVLGGTFNPFSKAHGYVIKAAGKFLNTKNMILLPTGDNFLVDWKSYDKKDIVPIKTRIKILEEFKRRNKNIEIEYCEVNKETSKTLDSLELIQNKHPNATIYFILGNEKTEDFERWYKVEEILKKYKILMFSRDFDLDYRVFKGTNLYKNNSEAFIFKKEHNKFNDISSTKIREAINNKDKEALRKMTYNYVIKILAEDNLL